MAFADILDLGARVFEAVAVFVLAGGLLWSAVLALWIWRRDRDGRRATRMLRATFGSALLLALEILIAADLIKTALIPTSVDAVTALGLIVLIRTFLSFSLEIEIDGVPPWRRARRERGVSPERESADAGSAADGDSGGGAV
ncbi:MAG TPA: DUF1622 domain-containing protein [Micromonosporaceae bacterium]